MLYKKTNGWKNISQEKMEEILPKLTAKVNDRVCECMGCCAPKDNNDWCFFPFMQQV